MIQALVLAAVVACNPADQGGRSPTPLLAWDHTKEATDGFRVYYRDADPTFQPDELWVIAADLSCWWTCPPGWEEDATCSEDLVLACWGTDQDYPIQRALELPSGVKIELRVTAYNIHGESGPSNVVDICWPLLMVKLTP